MDRIVDWTGKSNAPRGSRELVDEDGVIELASRIMVGGCILDVGCGYGRLAQFVDPSLYHGCDADSKAVKRARENFPGHSFGVCDLRFSKVPVSYDWVFLSNVLLHHTDGDVKAIASNLFPKVGLVVAETMEDRAGRECGGVPTNNRTPERIGILLGLEVSELRAIPSPYVTRARREPTDTHVALFSVERT